jgi:acetyl-CoA carboxylase, biotin carboxylase subunit
MAAAIRRVLIANRGEIAVRVQRGCRDMGIETVQVYSEADRHSLAVKLADRAVCIGGPRSADSYLNQNVLVKAAKAFQADAIHPGYGFLSENAGFAALCEREGLTWIGPSADVIRLMGNKAAARQAAAQAGLKTTPGSAGIVRDSEEAARVAASIGFPLILKASAGGGGRGMRLVSDAAAMQDAFAAATREAEAAFGDGSLYVEKFLTRVRHVEVQVLGDGRTAVHLGERDCSTQRRNQKLVEESPAPGIDDAFRNAICEAAAQLAQSVGYTSAGTVEFIVDDDAREFFFMEMNTRIQVEHPVTEMVTGSDLVGAQLRIAAGEGLGIAQKDVECRGHAIECRINAEDPAHAFAPSPGTIASLLLPGGPGIRVDTHVFHGYTIPPFYDSLIAKVIAWGADRTEAISRMQRALREMRIDGIKTTIPFHRELLADSTFRRGRMYTRYIEEAFGKDAAPRARLPDGMAAATRTMGSS